MSAPKRPNFIDTEEAKTVRRLLEKMQDDESYETKSSYNANTEKYPDHRISFVDKHMQHLASHPNINTEHYMANLRLMTRIR